MIIIIFYCLPDIRMADIRHPDCGFRRLAKQNISPHTPNSDVKPTRSVTTTGRRTDHSNSWLYYCLLYSKFKWWCTCKQWKWSKSGWPICQKWQFTKLPFRQLERQIWQLIHNGKIMMEKTDWLANEQMLINIDIDKLRMGCLRKGIRGWYIRNIS